MSNQRINFLVTCHNNNSPTNQMVFHSFVYHILDLQHNHYLSCNYLHLPGKVHYYCSNSICPTIDHFRCIRNLEKGLVLKNEKEICKICMFITFRNIQSIKIDNNVLIYHNNSSSKISNLRWGQRSLFCSFENHNEVHQHNLCSQSKSPHQHYMDHFSGNN